MSTKTIDQLKWDLSIAQASYDWSEVAKLEAEIQKLQWEQKEHQEEMTTTTQTVNDEQTNKINDLKLLLNGIPENPEAIVEKAKTRLQQTIDRYIEKIKNIKNTNTEEVNKLKEELKTERNTYEKVKKDFFEKSNYNFEKFTKEDLAKISTSMVRYATREGKLFNSPKLTKLATFRRNHTLKTLIKKFNTLGDDPKNWVRFIMGFEKSRFLRYTGIRVSSIIDKAGSNLGMQMNPQEFHAKFNAGKNKIFSLLDANTGDTTTEAEKGIITAIKNRINYYGATYARERANARVAPFIDTEKSAPKEARIIQMYPQVNESKTEQKAAA